MFFNLSSSKTKLSSLTLFAITIFYMIAIILLVISEKVGFPGGTGRLINNIAHIPIFFILTTLYLIFFNSLSILSVKLSYLSALVFAIMFSLLTEYLQLYTNYRIASFIDACLNLTGIILAMIFYKKLFCKLSKILTRVNPNK